MKENALIREMEAPLPSEAQIENAKRLCLIRLIDDDLDMREALSLVLSMEGWNTRAYESAEAFFRDDAPSTPGVMLLDVRMPGMSGLEALQVSRERGFSHPIVFLTGHGDLEMAVWAIKQGAVDFVGKPVNHDRLLGLLARHAVEDVQRVEGRLTLAEATERWARLSERERSVMTLLGKGLVNRDIAERLAIAHRTVEVHRQSALKKLSLKTPEDVTKLLEVLAQAQGSASE